MFSTGLFRCNEFIRFQAIAEVPVRPEKTEKTGESIEDGLDDAIWITHRIADTQKVARLELPSRHQAKRRVFRYLGLSILVTLGLGAAFSTMFFRGLPADIHFIIKDAASIQHEIRITPRVDGKITLEGVRDEFYQRNTVEEFFKRAPLTTKVVLASETKQLAILSLLYISLPWAMCLYAYTEHRRAGRLRRLLGVEER